MFKSCKSIKAALEKRADVGSIMREAERQARRLDKEARVKEVELALLELTPDPSCSTAYGLYGIYSHGLNYQSSGYRSAIKDMALYLVEEADGDK